MTNSGKLQADQSQADEVSSIVVDSQSKCIGVDEAEQLVERNYAAIYRYAYRLAGCAATAEDITQDVFMKAIAHLDQLRSGDAERSWLMSIARREFMRWLRQVARPALGRPSSLDEQSLEGSDMNSEARTPPLDNQDWVQAALGQLHEDARVALLMYYFEDLSYAEIAQQLQIPIGTVMSRLSRGREHLRQGLQRLASPQPSADTATAHTTTAHTVPADASLTGAARTTPVGLHMRVIGPQTDSKSSAQEAHHG